MNYFYSNRIKDNRAFLNPFDSKHCIQVLRMKQGDEIHLLDGKGNVYNGVISIPDKHVCEVEIVKTVFEPPSRNYKLEIAIAPTKNMSRFEWFLEKACEIGIDQIHPIICQFSERKKIREDRMEKILISAMKQSGNVYLPGLSSLCTFDEFLTNRGEEKYHKFIACMSESASQLQDTYKKEQNVQLLIGPEGGFSDKEVEYAKSYGFKTISLGKTRLRTETAGIYLCSAISILNQ